VLGNEHDVVIGNCDDRIGMILGQNPGAGTSGNYYCD
jgi:hypothetical protein